VDASTDSAALLDALEDVFGPESVAASDPQWIVKPTGERVLRCRSVELGLAEDGHVWCAARRGGVAHLAVLHDGQWVWVASVPVTSPSMN